MAIEIAPTAAPAKASGNSASDSSAKGGSSQASAKGGASFLSILGAMDGQGTLPTVDGAGLGGLTVGPAPDATDDGLLGSDADGPLSTLTSPDPAAWLAQLQLVPVQAPVPQAEANPAAVAGGKSASLRIGESRFEAGLASDAGSGKAAGLPLKSGKAILDAAAHAANAASAGDGDSKAAPAAQAAEGKFALPESVAKAVREVAATLSKAPEGSTLALAGAREKTQESQGPHKLVLTDVVAAVPTGAGGAMGVDGVVANASAGGVDGQFSEQVSYWMGGDIKKAELVLDGIGVDPVEVSISMQGNEAHVVFRTDEVQTREALSNATLQLRESLDRQGVVLSGVSVGTSHAGGESSSQQQGRKENGWKTTKVEAAPLEVKPNTRLAPGGAIRSVDLFV